MCRDPHAVCGLQVAKGLGLAAAAQARLLVTLHGTPRQWDDPLRPWLAVEKNRSLAVLRTAGVPVQACAASYLPAVSTRMELFTWHVVRSSSYLSSRTLFVPISPIPAGQPLGSPRTDVELDLWAQERKYFEGQPLSLLMHFECIPAAMAAIKEMNAEA